MEMTHHFRTRDEARKRTMDTFRSLYSDHQWELVQARSERSIRSVYRLVKGGTPAFYIKIYAPQSPLQKLGNLIKPRTLTEAKMLRSLKAAGIPVPEVHAHVIHGCASALVTKAVDPARGLAEVEEARQAAIMLDMAVLLLQKGYAHTDMHHGNIILDSKGQPCIIDAYEIVRKRKIKKVHVIDLLAQVDNVYHIPGGELAARLDRLPLAGDQRALIRRIKARSAAMRRLRVRRWVRRTLRQGSFARKKEAKDYTAFVNRRYALDLDDLIARHRAQGASRSPSRGLQREATETCIDGFRVVSYPRAMPFSKPFAVRAWGGLLTLAFNSIPVPDPVAVVVFKDKHSILITEALREPSLKTFLSQAYAGLDSRQKRELAAALGKDIGNIHASNICPANLTADSITVAQDPLKLTFLAVDQLKQRKTLTQRKRLAQLAKLFASISVPVSRSLRMTFMKAYARMLGDDVREICRIWSAHP